MTIANLIHKYSLMIQHMEDDLLEREEMGYGPSDKARLYTLRQVLGDLKGVTDNATDETVWNDADDPPVNDDYVLLRFRNLSLPMIGRYEGNEEDGGNYYIGDDDEPASKSHLYVDGWTSIPGYPGKEADI